MPTALSEHNTAATAAPRWLAQAGSFKARPVNKKVLESAGDLGVPRVQKKAPTMPREFNLSSSRPSSAKSKDAAHQEERPLYSSFGKPPSAAKLTTPRGSGAVAGKPRGSKPAVSQPQAAAAPKQEQQKQQQQQQQQQQESAPLYDPPAADTVASVPVPAPRQPAPEAEPVSMPEATPADAAVSPEPAAEQEDLAASNITTVEEPDDAAAAVATSAADPAAAVLTLGMLQAIQAENFADDVAIEFEVMKHWTVAQARTFFESGGEQRPVQEVPPPASPQQHLIKADDATTPATVEF